MDLERLAARLAEYRRTMSQGRRLPTPPPEVEASVNARLRDGDVVLRGLQAVVQDMWWRGRPASATRVVADADGAAEALARCLKLDAGTMRELGSGAYGTVFLSRRARGGEYAIKIEQLVDSDAAAKRFRRTARIARKAAQLGVGPAIHGAVVCRTGNVVHGITVMDVVPGTPAVAWAETASPGDIARVARRVRRMARKLHGAGIWHGDLHMGNVIVAGDDVKIIDYGLAATFRDLCRAETSRWEPVTVGKYAVWNRLMALLVADGTIRLRR